MTDKQIIDCKYKFQNDEKFEGKPYCTLHNELCEDLSFACDNNCQIYEDYKQLKRAENQIVDLNKMVEIKEQELKNICKAFDIEYAIDEETGNLIGRCNKLYKKEQELQQAMDNYVQLDLQRVKAYNELVDLYKAKEQECERLNEYSVGFARKCQKLELDVFHLKDKNYNLQRQLDQLKAENSKLKQRIIEIDRSYKNRQEELEQILAEIKEIANYSFNRSTSEYMAKLELILEKISEVQNDKM